MPGLVPLPRAKDVGVRAASSGRCGRWIRNRHGVLHRLVHDVPQHVDDASHAAPVGGGGVQLAVRACARRRTRRGRWRRPSCSPSNPTTAPHDGARFSRSIEAVSEDSSRSPHRRAPLSSCRAVRAGTTGRPASGHETSPNTRANSRLREHADRRECVAPCRLTARGDRSSRGFGGLRRGGGCGAAGGEQCRDLVMVGHGSGAQGRDLRVERGVSRWDPLRGRAVLAPRRGVPWPRQQRWVADWERFLAAGT